LTRRGRLKSVLQGPRILVVVFAIVLAGIAIGFGSQPSILWFGLQIMGYTYGGLLGLFLVACCLHRFADDLASLVAALSSIVVVVILTQWGIGFGFAPIPWPWAVVIGASWTCILVLIAATLRQLRQNL
jgi:hypothetical protein